ncbi:HIT family protein [Streptomyces spectabilis]|uniref:HIT domain-containing protein n=1 Tax=Streptomyces spectabilis TaxID=68270 RepID=A0A516RIM8_STRST|nr:HIT domain-containing protein [Streptomyces spectabilis]QDQ15510.1 HIT domain-containing protein [Streptomyces spectabilis]
MADEDTAAACVVCATHRGDALVPGGPVGEDDLVVVSHLSPPPPDGPGRSGVVYLGHLLVEPRRHAAGLADLTNGEAQRVGLWCARAARALREAGGAEHVYAAVIGDNVPHLHVHLLPRYPGTPRAYWWHRVDEWPDAPRGGASEVAALVRRLRSALG